MARHARHGGQDFADIRALVCHPLHIGQDFQGGGDDPQIPGQRLLEGQQVHTAVLDGLFHGVDLGVPGDDPPGQRPVHGFQAADGVLHECVHPAAHLRQIGVQAGEFLVEQGSGHIVRSFVSRNGRLCNPRCACRTGC